MQRDYLTDETAGGAPWCGGERRAQSRVLTIYLAVRIATRGDHGLARAVNMSDDGVQLSTQIELPQGEEITLDFSETCSIKGVVQWQMDSRCGIRFTTPLDSAALLKQLSDAHASGQFRQFRLPMSKAVIVRSELGLNLLRARDISQRGMKLLHDGRFTPGMQVKVQLASGIERRGFVRWSNNGCAGIMLTDPLSVDQLGSIHAI